MTNTTNTSRGLTVPEVAARYRVSAERVHNWIKSGALRAINRRGKGVLDFFRGHFAP